MEKIKEIKEFIYPASSVWSIISDISRCDWVPGVESIELEGNKRVFKMQGMGRLVEEILSCDNDEMKLTYSAIETIAPISHHLATIKLTERDDKTIFEWSTEIDPPEFSDAIRQGMLASLDKLEEVLKNT
ncbi:MAG: SRPBCC family protein [Pseudomonadota bacterium]|nr:SRPBCC family protein [Pseudomonadota bacterium]